MTRALDLAERLLAHANGGQKCSHVNAPLLREAAAEIERLTIGWDICVQEHVFTKWLCATAEARVRELDVRVTYEQDRNANNVAMADARIRVLEKVADAARRLNSFPIIDLDESEQIEAFDALTDTLALLGGEPTQEKPNCKRCGRLITDDDYEHGPGLCSAPAPTEPPADAIADVRHYTNLLTARWNANDARLATSECDCGQHDCPQPRPGD